MKHKMYRNPRAGNPIPPKWLGEQKWQTLAGGPLDGATFTPRYEGDSLMFEITDTSSGIRVRGYYDNAGAWVRC